MRFTPSQDCRIAPSASTASALTALYIHEREHDTAALAIPRTETQLVFRFGPSPRGGLDAHAMGARQSVHRKLIRAGHWSVTARFRPGEQQAVLGVPASELAGRIVALEDLWGERSTQRLYDRLAQTGDRHEAAAIVESAIAERLKCAPQRADHTQLALDAADRLTRSNVSAVAVELGVSDRHLRRVFGEVFGVSPKVFAKLSRFRHALHIAREHTRPSWASVAASAGYYDQAHLIAEFRAIANATPRALLGELDESARGMALP